MSNYFIYHDFQLNELIKKDKVLGVHIKELGPIKRPVIPDLFISIIHTITSQLISTTAAHKIFERIEHNLSPLTPEHIVTCSIEEIKQCGLTLKKATTIHQIASKITSKKFDFSSLHNMNDKDAIDYLCTLDGIGPWSAKMLLLHSLNRMDITSYEDVALRRGLCQLYQLDSITSQEFYRIMDKFSPYRSIASIYLWKISSK